MHSTQHHKLAMDYFDSLENHGYDMTSYRWMLRSPGTVSVDAMLSLCREYDLEIGDLLVNGIGRMNTYDEIDDAVSRSGQGDELGVVQHVA